MAYEVVIENAEGIADLTLNGLVKRGDGLAHNGTNWVQSDASDAATNLYAQYIAMHGGKSGDIIKGCKSCVLYDEDAPYTANAVLYVSATAGALTHTKPATAADVIQRVGRAISTKRAHIVIKPPTALEQFLYAHTYDSTSEPGLGVVDSPAWVGPAIDSTSEAVYFQGRIPDNAIALEEALVIFNSIGETTITVTGALVVAADGATNTGDTGTDIAATAPTGIANNKICTLTITTAFDADALKAGYNWTYKIAESGASDGDLQVIGVYLRWTVV